MEFGERHAEGALQALRCTPRNTIAKVVSVAFGGRKMRIGLMTRSGVAAIVLILVSNFSAASDDMSGEVKRKPPTKLATPTISLSASSDTGWSSSDRYTRDNVLTFTGRGPKGTTIELYKVGWGYSYARVGSNGRWTAKIKCPDTTFKITAVAKSGELESKPSKALTVTVDRKKPGSSTIDLAPASDDGVSPGDNVTTVRTPTFLGVAPAGTQVTVFDGARAIKSVMAPTGRWTMVLPLQTTGRHTYRARATDRAGNMGMSGPSLTVTYLGPLPGWSFDLAGLNGANGSRFDGPRSPSSGVFTAASLGDVNGDGFDDVAVASYSFSDTSAFVVLGKSGAFAPTVSLESLVGAGAFKIIARQSDGFGTLRIDGAGDINADGFDDMLVSAPAEGSNSNNWEQSFVLYGRGSGFPPIIDLDDLDAQDGFQLVVPTSWTNQSGAVGYSLAGLGDFNGDGVDDFAVGAPGSKVDSQCTGSTCVGGVGNVFVVFGRSAGFGATVDLSTLDGDNGFRIAAPEASVSKVADLGRTVVAGGDINGDGRADLLVGAPASSLSNVAEGGLAFVIFGSDNATSVMSVAALDGQTGFRIDGDSTFEGFGQIADGVGDVNGDGFDDLAFGRPFAGSWSELYGSVRIFLGKAGGFPAARAVSSLTGSAGFVIEGPELMEAMAGQKVAGVGDVNDDGFDDIAVSAIHYDINYEGGAIYIVFGRAAVTDTSLSAFGASSGVRLVAAAARAGFPGALASAGDINGDGKSDLMIGARMSTSLPSQTVFLVRGGRW